MISVGFFTGVNTSWVVQNNKPVIDAMNGFNKRTKATSVSTFAFSTLYAKLPYNKLLMVFNSLINFCFDGGESKYITYNDYGARWVKILSLIQLLFLPTYSYIFMKVIG